MTLFNSIDESMVTDFVIELTKFCPYCGGRCYKSDYPYASRCSGCSAFFHLYYKTCHDIEGYDTYFCTSHLDLRLVALVDGSLVEVCSGCIKWLIEEGYVNEYVEG